MKNMRVIYIVDYGNYYQVRYPLNTLYFLTVMICLLYFMHQRCIYLKYRRFVLDCFIINYYTHSTLTPYLVNSVFYYKDYVCFHNDL